MNYVRAMLSAAALVVVIGAMGTVQADDKPSITLYTAAIHTGVIACNAINVSNKTLDITISIFEDPDPKGERHLLAGPTFIPTNPGTEATIDIGAPTDDDKEGYCVFNVSGTRNRDDVRAVQNAVLAGTRSVDGGKTTFPFFITRVLEAR
jgi:hypothetical protein